MIRNASSPIRSRLRLAGSFLLVACTLLATPVEVSADIRLPSIFGDHMVLQRDKPLPVWGWAEPGERVTVQVADKRGEATADDQGAWRVTLPAISAGGPHEMVIAGKNTIALADVLIGEVWVCSGQSNMQFPVHASVNGKDEVAAAAHPNIRLFSVKRAPADQPQTDCEGDWKTCRPDTVGGFSAVAYFFGRHLSQELDVPVGLINTSWGGTLCEAWTSDEGLKGDPDFQPILERRATAKGLQNRASHLYNGMIAPLVPFAIRGAIWYQGESNVSRAWQYRKLFPAMIQDWRKAWGQGDFAFLFVQLAPYRYNGQDKRNCAELWEAQFKTLKLPNTGMAVTVDVGNVRDIHPKNKQDVGKRLALWALGTTYGKDIVYSGPLYRSLKIDGDRARITFDHVDGGLVSQDGKPLRDFEIAGADQQFLPATATVEGKEVVVRSEAVAKPAAVRYGWYDAAQPNLSNKEGLPASPFRTDDWPAATEGKK
ncbi:MAG: sialate O-acetylesterase [Pirellulales bacterium]